MNLPAEVTRPRRRNPPVSLLYLVKQLELAVTVELERVTSIAGLTPLQYTALTSLERHPGITSAQLARNSFVRAQSMAEMVSGMMQRELISRKRDPKDGRHYLLYLTPKGRALVDSLRAPVHNVERLMVTDLTPPEVDSLRHLLQACQRSLISPGPASAPGSRAGAGPGSPGR